MSIKPYQTCRSNEGGWIPVQVASQSTPGLDYIVHVNPWGVVKESICECPGYHWQGHCRHQGIAHDSVCRWSELEGPEEQIPEQAQSKTCPRCGGPTKWEMEYVEDD